MFFDVYSELCKEKGVSPSRAAIEMGINKGTVSIWKNQGTNPQVLQLHKIASYFNVSVDYLLGKTDKKTASAVDADAVTFDDFTFALYNETKELSDDKKQALLEMAQFFKQQQEKGK